MATAMKRAGYRLEEIAWVLKHKTLESLEHYLTKPTMEDQENFSNCYRNRQRFKCNGVLIISKA